MQKLFLAFSISLDGFVAGPDISPDQPMGRAGESLHDWMFQSAEGSVDREMAAEQTGRVGAVILGRRTFDLGLPHWDGTPYPAPSFVLTHSTRAPMPTQTGTFMFVNDGIDSALRQAKAVAAGKDIIVMGGDTAAQYLRAGLIDEMMLQLVPITLGGGPRLFAVSGVSGWTVKRVEQTPFVTHLHLVRSRDSRHRAEETPRFSASVVQDV